MANKKILLYHRLKSVKTIQDFIDHEYLNIEAQDLFNENKERIFTQMSEWDKTLYKSDNGNYPTSGDDLNVNMILPCPCTLLIDPKYITAEIAINQTNLQEDTDDLYAFEDEKIQEIINDDSYSDEVDKRAPSCQVIGWLKSKWQSVIVDNQRQYLNAGYAYENLTKDVISINIGVGKNGGNFTIRFPHLSIRKYLLALSDKHTGEKVAGTDFYGIEQSYDFVLNNSNYKETSIYGSSETSREKFSLDKKDLYSTIISSNDLLFISMHHNVISSEEGKRLNNIFKNNLDVDLSTENNKIVDPSLGNYDMIGLVDEVKIITDSQGTQIGVEVTGRDLMKLIIEDGSFFFNPSITAEPARIFWNDKKSGDILSVTEFGDNINPLQRMIGGARDISNMISIFAHKPNMSIEFVLKTVLSQLTNISVVPDDTFDGFPNRTTYLDLKPKKEE